MKLINTDGRKNRSPGVDEVGYTAFRRYVLSGRRCSTILVWYSRGIEGKEGGKYLNIRWKNERDFGSVGTRLVTRYCLTDPEYSIGGVSLS